MSNSSSLLFTNTSTIKFQQNLTWYVCQTIINAILEFLFGKKNTPLFSFLFQKKKMYLMFIKCALTKGNTFFYIYHRTQKMN